MVKFNVSILNRLKIMVFLVNAKYKNKHNVIFNESITKLVTILTKFFFHICISEPYKLPWVARVVNNIKLGFMDLLSLYFGNTN